MGSSGGPGMIQNRVNRLLLKITKLNEYLCFDHMKSFWAIIAHVKGYKGYALLNLLFNLITILFSLVSLSMVIPFLSLLFGTQELVLTEPKLTFSIESMIKYFNFRLSQIILIYGSINALVFICLVVIVVFFIKNLFRYLALFCLSPIRNGVVRDIRYGMYGKITTLPLSYFSEARKGDIIMRMTSDVQEIEWSIMSTLEVLFKEPLTIIAYLWAMFFISPQLTLFVLVMLPLTGLVIGQIAKSLKRESAKAQSKLGELSSFMEETISGFKIIKAFIAEKIQVRKFGQINNDHFNIMNNMLRRRELSSPLTEFLAISVVVIVLWYGARIVLNVDPTSIGDAQLKPQTFIGFMLIFSQLIPPAKTFSKAFYLIQKGMASFDRINSILQEDIKIKEKEKPEPLPSFESEIEFKNVTFSYEQEVVLDHVNLTIPKGKMIALFGPSGAGKSTLVDLVCRFYDTNEGEILIDGKKIKDVKLNDLRKQLGYVTQESILFNDTVMNNIAFGMPDAKEEDIIRAAKVANAHEFIAQLENGYQTNIGEQGSKLSGGQRQRLTIARAVLKNPPILILDEATSSLDAASEKMVQDALLNLMKNRTSIVIAHRLSTIQHADEIIVLQNGKITERGTHSGLMAKKGVYKKLVELQAF